jgi:hypothetical protein
MMNTVYGGWTPLRNALRKLDLHGTLGVIRAYSAFRAVHVSTPFPADIEVHPAVSVALSQVQNILPVNGIPFLV